MKMEKSWRKLKICRAELQLEPTLAGGQSFRWKKVEPNHWIGIFLGRIWILSQEDNHLLYKTVCNNHKKDTVEEEKETEKILKSYFRLDVDLKNYYKKWAEADSFFQEAAPKLFGIRILKQDVVENLFSFICSSNNNIKRISSMVKKLCDLYGEEIGEVRNEIFKSFPTVEKLTGSSVESDLRNAGFGYRAKFIHQSACLIQKLGGSVWLGNLTLLPYQEAKKELMKLPGVGSKVADCICLMSLGHLEAVPVDTHIFQVATKIYLPHLRKCKSLTDKVYNEIGDHFRSLHGPYAGWANTVLAKKGSSSSSSEEDRTGSEVFQVWPYPRPGRGPKPFKFRGPKHQIHFVSRPQYLPQPQYQQSFFPQRPQYQQPLYPQSPQVPQYPNEPQISQLEVQQYLENVQKQMIEYSAKAYKELQMIENEIDRNRKQIEDTMKREFQTLELSLEAKQAKEIQNAVKDGKDELKIQECLAEEEDQFRADMNDDIRRTTDCINDATERARKGLTEVRNAYTETSIVSSMQAREWGQKIKSCAERGDNPCIREGVALISEKTKNTVQEGSQYFQKLQESPRQQMIQMDYCRENFKFDLKDMREAYSKMIKRCIIASEIQEPEEVDEDDKGKEKDKKPQAGNLNVNVEAKPEAPIEV